MKFLCQQCKAKYQIADEKVAGKTVRMKCRKCGHLIEMRAAVTESSAPVYQPGPASAPPSEAPEAPAKAPAKVQSPTRPTSLAASLTAQRPVAPKPDRLPGGLAGAFKSSVQREDEVSAPFDMSELSPGDDWYVAINGVPVGPIRGSEVRRKAASGSVTEDSLVWQEGLDEWRPLRTFPELAAIVREATGGARGSFAPPPPEARKSVPPPARAPSTAHHPVAPRVAAPRAAAPAPRSNVVAISSRLATAEKLDEPDLATIAAPNPVTAARADKLPAPVPVAADPFTATVPSAPVAAAPAFSLVSADRLAEKKGPPWIIILMLVIGAAFGMTAALVIVLPKPVAPVPVIVQVPAPPTSSSSAVLAPPSSTPIASQGSPADSAPTTASAKTSVGPVGSGAPRLAPSASASTGARTLDLHGIGTLTSPGLGDDSSGDSKPVGQCLSDGQVMQVIELHRVAIRRSCWERNPSAKPTANISVTLTIGPDGSAQTATASGDDPAVAKCIENDVRGWHFPAAGCSQKAAIPFKFVRQ